MNQKTKYSIETLSKPSTAVESVVVRFAGDSGDGMQLAGSQLAMSSALSGNDISTFPNYPAEIRAPKGSLMGVSYFQVHFASHTVNTAGDQVNVLIAMNPAALKGNIASVVAHGTVIVDTDAFTKNALRLAGYETDPLKDESLKEFQLIEVPLTSQTRAAVASTEINHKNATRCRNFFAMGIVYWLYGRNLDSSRHFINKKFDGVIAKANSLALASGWNFGETTESFARSYTVAPAKVVPGTYRNITGSEAMSLGLVTAAHLSAKNLFYSAYPITPASDILQRLSCFTDCGTRTFQAEDEIAAITSSIGAAFGGSLAATGSSGPGIALKTEAMGLAIMLELPLLIINVQRGGPSTGLPTKVEQSDLLQAVFGRNGEAPMPVLAASGPSDCFNVVLDAWRIATKLMTPVMILSDANIANGAEPWLVPQLDKLDPIVIHHPQAQTSSHSFDEDTYKTFQPYIRDEWLARPWAIPGTPGLTHRIGGLEKANGSGAISYDPDNHQAMVNLRQEKVAKAVELMPTLTVTGPSSGDLLIISWGGTKGACHEAVSLAQKQNFKVSHLHLRLIHPLPKGLETILAAFDQVLVAELNQGQLRHLLRAQYLVDIKGLNKVRGEPFLIGDISKEISTMLAGEFV